MAAFVLSDLYYFFHVCGPTTKIPSRKKKANSKDHTQSNVAASIMQCTLYKPFMHYLWQSQVENEHYSYHFLTPFFEFMLL